MQYVVFSKCYSMWLAEFTSSDSHVVRDATGISLEVLHNMEIGEACQYRNYKVIRLEER